MKFWPKTGRSLRISIKRPTKIATVEIQAEMTIFKVRLNQADFCQNFTFCLFFTGMCAKIVDLVIVDLDLPKIKKAEK